MQLSNIKIKALLKQKAKGRHTDGHGLNLEIAILPPTKKRKVEKVSARWRFRYYFNGREQLLSLGTYPEVTLKMARERRDEARRQVASGINPSEVRKTAKAVNSSENSFEAIAREWHENQKHKWADTTAKKILRRFEKDVFPLLGKKPIRDLTSPELLRVLRRIEARGIGETVHSILQDTGRIFRYALATGRADRDISGDLRGGLKPIKTKHFATITEPVAVGSLLRAIEGYEGSFITKCAMELSVLVFVRPGELRHAEWQEFDLDKRVWRIPEEKMKVPEQHLVPLSKQAIEVIQTLQPLTGTGSASKYLFPSVRTFSRPMSENTVNAALRRMGYQKDEICAHGFRGMASTLLNENGWRPDVIERQLAHAERNNVRKAYNHAEYWPERTEMMQWWADYLDDLKAGGKIIKAKFGTK